MIKKITGVVLTLLTLPGAAFAWTYVADMSSYPGIGGGYSCTNRSSSGYGEVVSDPTAPSPTKSLRGYSYEGFEDAKEPFHCYRVLPSPVKEIYFSYWFKYSNNYTIHPTISKHIYYYGNNIVPPLENGGEKIPRFMLGVHPYLDGGRMTAFWGGSLGQPYRYANVGSEIVIKKGTWYRISGYAYFGTPGKSDGSYKLYVNGVLKQNYSNIPMLRPSDTGISETSITPVWGGNNDITVPAGGMDQWYDDMIISSEAISGVDRTVPPSDIKYPNPPFIIGIQ